MTARTYLSDAITYVQESGDELERARLAGLLGRPRAEPKAARALLGRQNDDGGFPVRMIPGRPSSVAATATALQWMQDLRLQPSSYVERAVAFFLLVQRPDGSWEESPAVLKFDPPPLIRPGTSLGRTYCTALAAGWLARLLGGRHDAVQRAAALLRARRDDTWSADEPVQVAALVAAALIMADGPTAPAAAAGMAALTRVPPDTWTADRLADALIALCAAGLPLDDPLITTGLERLLNLQRPDGGWSSEHGADRDADLTLRALSVLLTCGVSTRRTAASSGVPAG